MIKQKLAQIESELKEKKLDRHENPLDRLAEWIYSEKSGGRKSAVQFICTHNSRRSQFSQVWFLAVQRYFGLEVADGYSGGTEVTACNERTAAALERAGFKVIKQGEKNPVYLVSDAEIGFSTQLWSKVYDDKANPESGFAAIMTCDHADSNCPFIPGADIRISQPYKDPKYSDGTDQEKDAYDRTSNIIATDMLRLFTKVKEKTTE